MEPKFQSSFIPKGPAASAGKTTATFSKKKSFFGIIASIIFALTIAGSLGVFGYNFYLKYRISQLGKDIENARDSIQPEVIERITRMDDRLNSTKTLLANHSVISPFFKFLEESTVKNVRFTDMTFKTVEAGLELRLQGQATGYSAIALQSEILNESKNFQNPVFSDLRLDKEGNVNFLFTALINPELLSYGKSIEDLPVVEVETGANVNSAATVTPATLLSPNASTTSGTLGESVSSQQN